jgi:hypothetical protein
MLYEYAVEPRAIGSSWETFRYVIEKFGFDKGRVISEFPKRWFREVYDATAGLSPVQKKRVEEALNQARKKKVVRCQRPYDPNAGDWLHNALTEHQRSPFRAIIAMQNPNGDDFVLPTDDLNELHPLMAVPRDRAVARDAASIAGALKELLRFGSHILFVDPFFDPYSARYKSTFRECLGIVKALNCGAICEIHYRYHDDKPSPADLEREAANLFRGVIPADMTVTIYCWRQKKGGEDFHDRFLLTDKGGIGIGAGFSAEGDHQTANMHLMSFELSQEKIRAFARTATNYELVEPVLRIASDGHVEHVQLI